MVSSWNIWSIIWIIGWWISIIDFIDRKIEKYSKKNSPIVKAKRMEITEIIDERYEETNKEINEYENKMLDKMIEKCWLDSAEKEQILSFGNDKEFYDKNIMKKIFKKSDKILDGLLLLVVKQIEWIEEWLNLKDQLNKEKENLIEQLWEDLNELMEINHSWLMQTDSWFSEQDINLSKFYFSFISDIALSKIEELFDKIIWKICTL